MDQRQLNEQQQSAFEALLAVQESCFKIERELIADLAKPKAERDLALQKRWSYKCGEVAAASDAFEAAMGWSKAEAGK